MPADVWIANRVSDLIQGDGCEGRPLERLLLQGYASQLEVAV